MALFAVEVGGAALARTSDRLPRCEHPSEREASAGHTRRVACGSPGGPELRGPARVLFGLGIDPNTADASALEALPGIGAWTAQYVAMRALHHPDAFPADDLGVRKALGARGAEAERRAARWRPWRAYGVMHLWESSGEEEGAP